MKNYKMLFCFVALCIFSANLIAQELLCKTDSATLYALDRKGNHLDNPNLVEASIFVAEKPNYLTEYVAKHKLPRGGNFVIPELKPLPNGLYPRASFTQELELNNEEMSFTFSVYRNAKSLSLGALTDFNALNATDAWFPHVLEQVCANAVSEFGSKLPVDSITNEPKRSFKIKLKIKKLKSDYISDEAYLSSDVEYVISLVDVFGNSLISKEMELRSHDFPMSLAVRKGRDFYINDFFQVAEYTEFWKNLVTKMYVDFFALPEFQETMEAVGLATTADSVVVAEEDVVFVELLKQDSPGARKSDWLKAIVSIEGEWGLGSGCIVSSDGLIITSYHVAYSKNDSLLVTLYNGEKLHAKLLQYDALTDLALLKVEAENLVYVTPQKDPQVDLKQKVWVIGTPANVALGQTITAGIVSGKRTLDGKQYFQTDANVNSGNSGGALFDAEGKMIGVVSYKVIDAKLEGIGFAISTKSIYEKLKIKIKE